MAKGLRAKRGSRVRLVRVCQPRDRPLVQRRRDHRVGARHAGMDSRQISINHYDMLLLLADVWVIPYKMFAPGILTLDGQSSQALQADLLASPPSWTTPTNLAEVPDPNMHANQ